MGIFDKMFNPPNVEKLRAKKNLKGLVKILNYKIDRHIQLEAISALEEFGDVEAVKALGLVLNSESWLVRNAAKEALNKISEKEVLIKKPIKEAKVQQKLFYPDGTLQYEGGVKEGKGHGEGKLFYPDGTLQYEGEIKEGKSHGEGKAYYENGILNYVGDWKDARYHGRGNHYLKNGSLEYVGSWENGKRNGKGKAYVEDGTLIIGEFKDNAVDGKAEWYNKYGVVKYSGDWKKGKMHGYGKMYDNGKYLGKFKWINGDKVD